MIRKQNKDLIALITDVTNQDRKNNVTCCSIDNIKKDDYLSIVEWLFKTFKSINVNYNKETNVNITIGL